MKNLITAILLLGLGPVQTATISGQDTWGTLRAHTLRPYKGKFKLIMHSGLILLAIALGSPAVSAADMLFERAGGAAYYDSQQDITWLTDANYANTVGAYPGGLMTYSTALNFINRMNSNAHLGITTWRAPAIDDLEQDGYQYYPCNAMRLHDVGEMDFLYGEILAGEYRYDCDDATDDGLVTTGPFINIVEAERDAYWYGTPYAGEQPEQCCWKWAFHMAYGGQHGDGGIGPVWPVFDGDLLYTDGDPLPVDAMVSVDIDPWSTDNIVKPYSDEPIIVLVHGSAEFDATQIDPLTLKLGFGQATTTSTPWIYNFNNDPDGHADAAFSFVSKDTWIYCNETEVALTGETFNNVAFSGTSTIDTRNCDTGDCHP